jgi:hypothetical protein
LSLEIYKVSKVAVDRHHEGEYFNKSITQEGFKNDSPVDIAYPSCGIESHHRVSPSSSKKSPSEHATNLSGHLWEVLLRIESAKEQAGPATFVKSIIAAMYTFINKVEGLPDYNTLMGAFRAIHVD